MGQPPHPHSAGVARPQGQVRRLRARLPVVDPRTADDGRRLLVRLQRADEACSRRVAVHRLPALRDAALAVDQRGAAVVDEGSDQGLQAGPLDQPAARDLGLAHGGLQVRGVRLRAPGAGRVRDPHPRAPHVARGVRPARDAPSDHAAHRRRAAAGPGRCALRRRRARHADRDPAAVLLLAGPLRRRRRQASASGTSSPASTTSTRSPGSSTSTGRRSSPTSGPAGRRSP